MLHKNTDIPLTVSSVQPETPGYLSVFFDHPRDFSYQPGDWLDIAFADGDLAGGKTYSLSSSPTEANLRITFREGISPLKKRLAGLRAGDKLHITQYGNDYGFQLRSNRSSVLIAGGVGIAPFRSMLRELVDRQLKNSVHLVYTNQTEQFIFKPELDKWAQQLPNLTITYLVTQDLNRKDRHKALARIITDLDQQFYIAGPAGMVESTEHFLLDIGVELHEIKIDSFDGY